MAVFCRFSEHAHVNPGPRALRENPCQLQADRVAKEQKHGQVNVAPRRREISQQSRQYPVAVDEKFGSIAPIVHARHSVLLDRPSTAQRSSTNRPPINS